MFAYSNEMVFLQLTKTFNSFRVSESPKINNSKKKEIFISIEVAHYIGKAQSAEKIECIKKL